MFPKLMSTFPLSHLGLLGFYYIWSLKSIIDYYTNLLYKKKTLYLFTNEHKDD